MTTQEKNILGIKNIYNKGPKGVVCLVDLRNSGKPE